MLHISQITKERVKAVSDVLSEGQEVKAVLLNQDLKRKRLTLSTKVLELEPGEMLRDQQRVFAEAEERPAARRQRLKGKEEAKHRNLAVQEAAEEE